MDVQRGISIAASGAVRHGVRALLDLLFPPPCMSCKVRLFDPHGLCASCWRAMSFIDGPVCTRYGLPFDIDPGGETVCGPCHAKAPGFDRARSLFRYDDSSKRLILGFKHGERLDSAPAFARWLDRTGRRLLAEADLIVPVPLHRGRLWKRRYNQTAILAKGLARLSSRPHDPFLLTRKCATPSQGEMPSAKTRRRNVLGAFGVPPAKTKQLRGRNILMVDDAFTTGGGALKRAVAARMTRRPLPAL